MAEDDGKVIRLFPDGDDGGEAIRRWEDRLNAYLDDRALLSAARQRPQPEPPWPTQDNPMPGYLIDRAQEIAATDGERVGLLWLGVHAWFEGALDERFRTVEQLTTRSDT